MESSGSGASYEGSECPAPRRSVHFAYAYDPAGRLSGVTKNGDPYRSYTYDANGNRTSVTRQMSSGPVTETATYDAQDKQTSSGDFDLTYNANGELASKTNRTTGDSQTYAYSSMGVLKSVTPSGGSTRAYKYDAAGNRVETRESGQPVQRLIYAPGLLGPVAELAGPGREETRFIYASRMNVPDYMVRGGRTYRLVTDQLGSVRFVVDAASGEIAQEITYDPFGEVISDSEPGFQPFGFAGGLYDSATGLTHFGAREYDAGAGRWTSRDPIGFAGGDGNLYGYVGSDPVSWVDPSGLIGLHIPNPFQPIVDAASAAGNAAASAGNWILENRGTLTSIAAGATCIALPAGCGAMMLVNFAVNTEQNLEKYAAGDICFDEFGKRVAVDGVLSWIGGSAVLLSAVRPINYLGKEVRSPAGQAALRATAYVPLTGAQVAADIGTWPNH